MAIKLTVPLIVQRNEADCWYACFRMLLWGLGRPPIVKVNTSLLLARRGINCGNPEWEKHLRDNGLNRVDDEYPFLLLFIDPQTIEHALTVLQKPIMTVLTTSGQHMSHAVVITGVKDNFIYYNDPWFSDEQCVNGDEFCRRVDRAWDDDAFIIKKRRQDF